MTVDYFVISSHYKTLLFKNIEVKYEIDAAYIYGEEMPLSYELDGA